MISNHENRYPYLFDDEDDELSNSFDELEEKNALKKRHRNEGVGEEGGEKKKGRKKSADGKENEAFRKEEDDDEEEMDDDDVEEDGEEGGEDETDDDVDDETDEEDDDEDDVDDETDEEDDDVDDDEEEDDVDEEDKDEDDDEDDEDRDDDEEDEEEEEEEGEGEEEEDYTVVDEDNGDEGAEEEREDGEEDERTTTAERFLLQALPNNQDRERERYERANVGSILARWVINHYPHLRDAISENENGAVLDFQAFENELMNIVWQLSLFITTEKMEYVYDKGLKAHVKDVSKAHRDIGESLLSRPEEAGKAREGTIEVFSEQFREDSRDRIKEEADDVYDKFTEARLDAHDSENRPIRFDRPGGNYIIFAGQPPGQDERQIVYSAAYVGISLDLIARVNHHKSEIVKPSRNAQYVHLLMHSILFNQADSEVEDSSIEKCLERYFLFVPTRENVKELLESFIKAYRKVKGDSSREVPLEVLIEFLSFSYEARELTSCVGLQTHRTFRYSLVAPGNHSMPCGSRVIETPFIIEDDAPEAFAMSAFVEVLHRGSAANGKRAIQQLDSIAREALEGWRKSFAARIQRKRKVKKDERVKYGIEEGSVTLKTWLKAMKDPRLKYLNRNNRNVASRRFVTSLVEMAFELKWFLATSDIDIPGFEDAFDFLFGKEFVPDEGLRNTQDSLLVRLNRIVTAASRGAEEIGTALLSCLGNREFMDILIGQPHTSSDRVLLVWCETIETLISVRVPPSSPLHVSGQIKISTGSVDFKLWSIRGQVALYNLIYTRHRDAPKLTAPTQAIAPLTEGVRYRSLKSNLTPIYRISKNKNKTRRRDDLLSLVAWKVRSLFFKKNVDFGNFEEFRDEEVAIFNRLSLTRFLQIEYENVRAKILLLKDV